MQATSVEYRKSMKSPLRERGYIRVNLGVINAEAQDDARYEGNGDPYSDTWGIMRTWDENAPEYGTLEDGQTKVDGSVRFLPRDPRHISAVDTGFISNTVSSEDRVLTCVFESNRTYDIKGISIRFGMIYPTEIRIETGVETFSFENDCSFFTTDQTFSGARYIKIYGVTMSSGESRMRVRKIDLGVGLTFGNDVIIDSMLEQHVSPIGEDVPQFDFSVTIANYDGYFNVDNPNSVSNFLKTGQPLTVEYGYHLPDSDEIEWIPGASLVCSEWEADDTSATIRAVDIFRQMEAEYDLSSLESRTYGYLAEEVLAVAGIRYPNIYIEPRLFKMQCLDALPIVTCREALQIICNATKSTLSVSRDGKVTLQSTFDQDFTLSQSSSGHEYSLLDLITTNEDLQRYGTLANNGTPMDGSSRFTPREPGLARNVGFMSIPSGAESANGAMLMDGFTVAMEQVETHKSLFFSFEKDAVPKTIQIDTFNDTEEVDSYYVQPSETAEGYEISVSHTFENFNKMVITFPYTRGTGNRVILNHFSIDRLTDFKMERIDMLTSPKGKSCEKIKSITVPYYTYSKTGEEEVLVDEDVTVNGLTTLTYRFDEPSYGYTATLNGSSLSVFEGLYRGTVTVQTSGKLKITAKRYRVTVQYVTLELNDSGSSIKWENPLIGTRERALDVAYWLADYYSGEVEYSYNTRGNPELDVNDIIYQENDFLANMRVMLTRHVIRFNQAFSGEVETRRIGQYGVG